MSKRLGNDGWKTGTKHCKFGSVLVKINSKLKG